MADLASEPLLPKNEPTELEDGRGCLGSIAVAALAPFSFGLAIGYSSPAGPLLLQSGLLDTLSLSIFESLSPLGAAAGAIAGGLLSDQFGRTRGLLLAVALPGLLGWTVLALARSSQQLFVGRVLAGAGAGAALNIFPLYSSECSPSSSRGGLGAVTQLAVNSGVTTMYALGLCPLLGFRALAALPLVPLSALATACFLLPESPRWLAAEGRGQEAAASLRRLRAPGADVGPELASINRALAKTAAEPPPSLADVTRPALARPLVIILSLMVLQQLSGVNAVLFSLSSVFRGAGIADVNLASFVTALAQLPVSLGTCFLMDRLGRRVLLLTSASGMSLASAALSLSLVLPLAHAAAAHRLALVAAMSYLAFFSAGLGPIPWLFCGELFPARGRGGAASLASVVSNVSAFAVTVSFAAFVRVLTLAGAFAFFALACGCTALFTLLCVPETKGKSLEEIGNLLRTSSRVTSLVRRGEEQAEGEEGDDEGGTGVLGSKDV